MQVPLQLVNFPVHSTVLTVHIVKQRRRNHGVIQAGIEDFHSLLIR